MNCNIVKSTCMISDCMSNGFANQSIVKYARLGYMGIPYGNLAIWNINFKNLISEFPHFKACLCLFFKLSLVLKNKTFLLPRVSSFRPYKRKTTLNFMIHCVQKLPNTCEVTHYPHCKCSMFIQSVLIVMQ